MPRFEVAHVREQGVDLIIVPLESRFEHESAASQTAMIGELQRRASGAGLAGEVVPVWEYGGRMRFIAHRNYHPYFVSLDMGWVAASVNRELYW